MIEDRKPVHLSAFLFASFPNAYEALFDDIQSYCLLDFPSTKPPLKSKRRTIVKNLHYVAILQVSGKLNLLINLNRVTLIVLNVFKFSFSH